MNILDLWKCHSEKDKVFNKYLFSNCLNVKGNVRY